MSIENDFAAAVAELKSAADEVKKSGELTQTEMKNLGDATRETKAKADEALTKQTEAIQKFQDLSARMGEMEQKMARRGGVGGEPVKTVGDMVAESEEMKALCSSKRGKANISIKAILSSLTTDADGSAGDLIQPQRVGMADLVPRRELHVRDLITPGRTNSNAITYPTLKAFTNAAATVAETTGAQKPQSDLRFDIVTSAVTTIAHWIPATKQILDDAPMLRSIINEILLYGLKYVEDGQLLNGGGTGTDLNGIYTQATAYSAPITVADRTKIDVIRLAMLQASLAELPATGVVLHPSDWADIELTKTAEGAYLFANPQAMASPRLWGMPVVTTQAMTIDKFLVGAFRGGAQVFDREDANIEVSTEHSDYFTKNLVAVRCEERLALAVYNALAFTKGDFSDSIA